MSLGIEKLQAASWQLGLCFTQSWTVKAKHFYMSVAFYLGSLAASIIMQKENPPFHIRFYNNLYFCTVN